MREELRLKPMNEIIGKVKMPLPGNEYSMFDRLCIWIHNKGWVL